MNQEEILSFARSWVASNGAGEGVGELAQEKVADVITESADLVGFTLDLEDALGLDDGGFDLEELAPKLATLTFAELADEVVKLVSLPHTTSGDARTTRDTPLRPSLEDA